MTQALSNASLSATAHGRLDHFSVEGRDVIRLAARYQTPIDDDLLIHPIRTSVPEVGLERRPGCDSPPTRSPHFDYCPRAMADCCHRLVAVEKRLRERHRFRQHSKRIRIDHATRQQQGIEVISPGVPQGDVDRELVGPIRDSQAFTWSSLGETIRVLAPA